MHPSIPLRLAAARTLSDASLVWRDFYDELKDYTFVISEPGAGASRFPAKLDLPDGAFLRSVFAHEHLYFLNHAIIDSHLAGESVDFAIDYTISFDSNTASYFRDLDKGHLSMMVPALHTCMKALGVRKLNWDYVPFLMQRAESILANRDLDFIYETALAIERFSACDLVHFEDTGEVLVTINEEEITRKAQHQLATWHTTLRRGVQDLIPHRLNFFYAPVLKMKILYLTASKRSSLVSNMAQFLEFLDRDIQCISLFVVVAAFEFFLNGTRFKPFSKLTGGNDLKSKAKNVAWDLYHVQQRREFATFSGRNGAFHLPFFLTFDKGLATLFDIFPQRSCLIGKERGMPQFFADEDFQARLTQSNPELLPVLRKHFTLERHRQRANVTYNRTSSYETLIAGLESELDKLVR
jgi:hypothetical protein